MSTVESPPGTSTRRRPFLRAPVLVPALAVAAVVVGLALWAFQPWRLFTSTTVREAPPVAASAPVSVQPPVQPSVQPPVQASAAAPAASPAPASPSGPATLAAGTFITHEHATTGQVAVIRLADGSRVLRLENLDTSDGPDLHVWLSDQPVRADRSNWTAFDDGAYLDLGSLKGNKGDQNYPIPADADLTRLTSVSVWCARFHVSFGAATLKAG